MMTRVEAQSRAYSCVMHKRYKAMLNGTTPVYDELLYLLELAEPYGMHEEEDGRLTCPRCGQSQGIRLAKYMNYCHRCGQRLNDYKEGEMVKE